MPRTREALTYRLRRLPTYLDRSGVANFLVRSVEGLGPPENIVIFSLASNLVSWERPPTKIATLKFTKTPERFDNDRTEWTVPLADQGESLIFDTHFLEFTPLSDCNRNVHQFDCIAISGLASHPLGSWMHRDSETNFVWLRDRLPKDMPAIRPIIYGYDTTLIKSESVQTIDDLASSFIARLKSVGRDFLSAKPLVIIAHSLGGILLRNAVIQMASSGDEETFILKSIKMIIFFGVPSKGMHMSHLLPMVEGQPNRYLVELLSPGSDRLSSLSQYFSNIATLHKIHLISAYETKRSRTTKKSESGNWERNGPYELLVDQDSAVQTDSNPQDCFPINEDHSDMVKFSDDSPDYRIAIRFMSSILSVVPAVATTVSGAEHVNIGNYQIFSDPRKQKAQKESHGISTIDPGLYAKPNPKKRHRERGRRNAAKAKMPLREENLQHENNEKQKNLKELCDSLDFAERSHRYERIKKAHTTTFDWIFEKPELGFVPWLRKGAGIYWIQGKPGSGKSTLMKFLHDHPQTSEILNQWRLDRHHTSAWFFFNERGSYIGKSFEGLLRSVIREIVSTNEVLAQLVLQIYLEVVKKSSTKKQTWHVQDLQRALSTIISQGEQDLEVLLCLDALDEYSGPPEMIADFVQSLVQPVHGSRTAVKVLFSSRPWDAFITSFSKQPGFKMHEQTKSDMRIFVLDQLGTGYAIMPSSTLAEASSNMTARDMVSTIVDRAEGVFLWVRLVVKSLMDAGPNTTTLQLEERLQALPNGLEELYERTLERIPRSSRLEAFIVLEIINRGDGKLDVREVTLAASCALGKTLHECTEAVEKISRSVNDEQAALQLKNLCGGLIETYGAKDEIILVQFMHQTVKDFVNRPGFERRTLGHSHAPLYENGFSFLMKYKLAVRELVRSSPHDLKLPRVSTRSENGYRSLISWAHRAEATTGNNQEVFLDSIGDKKIRSQFDSIEEYDGPTPRPISVLSFAVLGNLLLYTRQKLRNTTVGNIQSEKSLLHFAVEATHFHHSSFSLARMTQLLLEKGSDINCKYSGQTPFQLLFTKAAEESDPGKLLLGINLDKVIETFIKYGQDTNIDIPIKHGLCKAMHIARNKASRTLLEHGANVNALDSRGRTPLDVLICGIRPSTTYSFNDSGTVFKEPRDTASILLTHGGCITYSTRKRLGNFIETVGQDDVELPASFLNMPELSLTLPQRVRSILPLYLGGL